MLNRFSSWGQSFWLSIALVGLSLVQTSAEEASEHLCSADLDSAIASVINRPELRRSRWGILIQTLATGETLYSLDAESYFIPASNAKLLISAAALRQLGSEFRIHTPVYLIGNGPNLTSLRIVGKGDPSLTTADLEEVAKQLKNQGVQQILQLIVEETEFSEPVINPSWEWSDLIFYYAVPINSLILNDNIVTLNLLPQKVGKSVKMEWSDEIASQQWQVENRAITTLSGTPYTVEINGVLGKPILQIKGELAIDSEPDTWYMAVPNPADYFLQTFRQVLLNESIEVTQEFVRRVPIANEAERQFTSIKSENLTSLLQKINQNSDNLYAESLLRVLGNELKQNSLEVVQVNLTELGVKPDSYILKDGSGLSRQNLVSPEALVQTLRLMAKTKDAVVYRESLAVAGVSGTLKNRFLETPIQGNLQGKTGTLTGVSALSGYLKVSDNDTLVFSLIINQSNQSTSELHKAIDEIVVLLGKLQNC